ncbi:MAG TPA: EAL domain-containing protein [Acetobacteraceae bacterium]|nr:EAL domain-containing protein [Acetobacteraceae bacterium]
MNEQLRIGGGRKRQAGSLDVQPTGPGPYAIRQGELAATCRQWWHWIASLTRRSRSRIGGGHLRFNGESLLPELAAIGCFLALLWASIGIALNHEYHSAETAAVQNTGNLARAFEESTRRTIGQIDQILLSARAFYAAQGPRFNFSEWARTQTLPDTMTAAIGMADSTGHVFADTLPFPAGVSIADRPHFRAQINPAHDNLFISKPVHGRVSGRDTIQFTRKLLGPHGEFAGVTVFSLGCTALSRFYQTLDLGNGFVSLLSADGTVLARGPLLPGMIGHKISETGAFGSMFTKSNGVIRFRGKWSNVEQIASFRHLQDYPLIVMVGLDADTVFQQYRSLRRRAVAGGIGATLAISVIGFLWLQQKRRSVASRRALTITLDTISQGILMVDARGNVPVANPRALDLLGVADGRSDGALRCAASRAAELARGDAAIGTRMVAFAGDRCAAQPGQDTRFETARDDGTVIEVRSHRLADGGFVHTYTDITEQRLADARVRYLAHHDTLTGLANRVQLRQRIPEFLDSNAGPQLLTAFMMIDLDGFKGVNDTLGHDVGDELLVEVARRLQGLVRDVDFVARLGGDEFVILVPGLLQPEAVAPLAQRVLQRLADPARVGDHRLQIGASIGIAFHPKDAQDGDALYKYADIALYAAKSAGRGTFRCFDTEMKHTVSERRLLESGLRRALENRDLEVHFQPIFASGSLELAGFEALARWRHPGRGYISPETFIRVAEDCGLIDRLGRWVIEEACLAAAAWQPQCRIAVNVSPMQLRDGRLQDDIAAILQRTGLPARLLEIEVTENVMADNNQTVLDTLHALKAMGVRIALDDFGTGYSSLSYLRRFSFDKIKIDKSFVQGQSNDQGVRVILEAILGLCHNLGLAVVGEGVETQQQLAMLRQGGCTELQGYLLGRPMPAGAVEAFLRSSSRHPRQGTAAIAVPKELLLAS